MVIKRKRTDELSAMNPSASGQPIGCLFVETDNHSLTTMHNLWLEHNEQRNIMMTTHWNASWIAWEKNSHKEFMHVSCSACEMTRLITAPILWAPMLMMFVEGRTRLHQLLSVNKPWKGNHWDTRCKNQRHTEKIIVLTTNCQSKHIIWSPMTTFDTKDTAW